VFANKYPDTREKEFSSIGTKLSVFWSQKQIEEKRTNGHEKLILYITTIIVLYFINIILINA